MGLKEKFQRKITMKVYERQCMVIITVLATLLFINIWPRFRSDVMSVDWYWYVILIVIFLILARGKILGSEHESAL
ncbi:MAG: hypothetical protein NWF08_08325 [Candidatus Bathyarchaeota archaeon]|nr:hypothetical protein [Candidatus Bathyarchaeota archaeon]